MCTKPELAIPTCIGSAMCHVGVDSARLRFFTMNFKGNCYKIGSFDIAALKERILALSYEEWSRWDYRQRKFEAHKDTRTIPVVFDEDMRHANPTVHDVYQTLKPVLEPPLAQIRRHYNKSLRMQRLQKKHGRAYPVRIILAKLLPGGAIPEHRDRGFSLAHAHRIHIPIKTNPDVVFQVRGDRVPPREGDIWEINNRRFHSVENRSDHGRIHLIIDWVIPGERCCCSEHTHPHSSCTEEACAGTDRAPAPCSCLD